MKRPVWLIALGIVVAAIVVFYVVRHNGHETVVTDLVAAFPTATEKKPSPDTFSVIDATIGGQQKRAIFTKDPSRLVYTLNVPENAQLKVSLGLLEDGWKTQGDGVLFRVLATPANGNQDELLNLDLNPFANPSDRSWHDLSIDLSEYAGETIQLFLNTNSSPPGRPQRDDRAGDLAVWGAPRIVTN
jgi:hypothetical protein